MWRFMIYKLSGLLDSSLTNSLVLDVNGVGYEVLVSQKTLAALPQPGTALKLFIEHIFREDNQILCGFLKEEERLSFRSLLTVQGVGVRVALAILSVVTPTELLVAIHNQDRTLLTRADGVGPKLAGRIVLELKGKDFSFDVDPIVQGASVTQEALSGLINLGYSKAEAAQSIQRALQETPTLDSVEEIVRLSLKILVRHKNTDSSM
jgi:Holliday junction DNA helicase RuvA